MLGMKFVSWLPGPYFPVAGELKMTELNDFLNNILQKIGEESCTRIGDTLKANNFTSRLPLK